MDERREAIELETARSTSGLLLVIRDTGIRPRQGRGRRPSHPKYCEAVQLPLDGRISDPPIRAFAETLDLLDGASFIFAKAWVEANGPIGGDSRLQYHANVRLRYTSYASPFSVVATFIKAVGDVPGWVDGFAKLVAHVSHFPNLVRTHGAEIETHEVEATNALEVARRDRRIKELEQTVRAGELETQLLQLGPVDDLLKRARELGPGPAPL